jgi:hypothetical protein
LEDLPFNNYKDIVNEEFQPENADKANFTTGNRRNGT